MEGGEVIYRRRPGDAPGPITTSGNYLASGSLSSFVSNAGRGVWVPAFAGTTTTYAAFTFSTPRRI